METKVETTLVTEELPVSSDMVETIVDQRVGPGILLLSPALQLLHINQRALSLCGKMTHLHNGKAATGVLPMAVTELCAEVVTAFRERTHAKDWEQVQIMRVLPTSNPPVVLRAFGMPDHCGRLLQARILILMEEVAQRRVRTPEKARERFRLTAREYRVVCYLARGHTNKGIANELEITEQTVKEHIKHIMKKMRTATRTGILARIFTGGI